MRIVNCYKSSERVLKDHFKHLVLESEKLDLEFELLHISENSCEVSATVPRMCLLELLQKMESCK